MYMYGWVPSLFTWNYQNIVNWHKSMADSCLCVMETTAVLWSDWPPTDDNKWKKKKKASILQHSAFFIIQLSHPYMSTGKAIALTRWTFVGKVMSLLFSMLSRLVITFLLRIKHLLNSWLQSPSAVILEPKKIKPVTVSIVPQSIWHEMMATVAWIVAWRYVKWMTANYQQKWYVTK